MQLRAVAVATLVACGSGSSQPGAYPSLEPTPADEPGAPVAKEPLTDEQVCARLTTLRDEGCPFLRVFGEDRFGGTPCLAAGDMHHNGTAQCLAEPTCDAVDKCMHATHEEMTAYSGLTRPCALPPGDPGLAYPAGTGIPAGPPTGATDTTFADTPSSIAKPLEVCTVLGIARYFDRVTCSDGTKPWKSGHAAMESGAMQKVSAHGGRCGRKLSAWAVPCPEGLYLLAFDSMHCPEAGLRP